MPWLNRLMYRLRCLCAKLRDFKFSSNPYSDRWKNNNVADLTDPYDNVLDTMYLMALEKHGKQRRKSMATKAQYPLNITAPKVLNITPGQFLPGHLYRCTWANPKAKKGENGQPRFTEGMTYMCIANASSTTETKDRPPVFLIDNNFRAVNVGTDAKIKSTFVDA